MGREGRSEAAFVLLLVLGSSWVIAGVAAVVFGIAGERAMGVQGVLTLLLGFASCWLAVAVVLRLRRARGLVLFLAWVCLVWSLLQFVLPIGSGPGPVAVLMGVGLPACLIWLLHGRRARAEFAVRH